MHVDGQFRVDNAFGHETRKRINKLCLYCNTQKFLVMFKSVVVTHIAGISDSTESKQARIFYCRVRRKTPSLSLFVCLSQNVTFHTDS